MRRRRRRRLNGDVQSASANEMTAGLTGRQETGEQCLPTRARGVFCSPLVPCFLFGLPIMPQAIVVISDEKSRWRTPLSVLFSTNSGYSSSASNRFAPPPSSETPSRPPTLLERISRPLASTSKRGRTASPPPQRPPPQPPLTSSVLPYGSSERTPSESRYAPNRSAHSVDHSPAPPPPRTASMCREEERYESSSAAPTTTSRS